MKKLLLLAILAFPLLAANPAIFTTFRLDAGATSYTINNSGSVAGAINKTIALPAGWLQAGVVLSPGVYVAPTAATTFTACAAPCGIGGTAAATTINMQLGEGYRWLVRFDGSGNISSPFEMTAVGAAYNADGCDALGTIPMIEPPITTTSPLPMPLEIVGQDCYLKRVQLPLLGSHTWTGLRLFLRIHSPIYDVLLPGRIDGKAEFQINNAPWQVLRESNSNVLAADEVKYLVTDNSGALQKFGGSSKVRDYLVTIPDGVIGQTDTTANIAWRFRGTDGKTSGYRILEMILVESTDCDVTNLVKTGTATVGTCASHGWNSGDDIIIRGAPGERMIFNGMRHLSAVTTNTFTFANSDYSSGGSKLSSAVLSDGSWPAPTMSDPNNNIADTQPHIYATRMLVARSSFTYTDPATWTAPVGGDATRGGNLFTKSNSAGTGGQHNLRNPVTTYFPGNAITAQCSNCHSPSGADIKFYGFSNESVEARSMFHGLSEQDGLDVAAFIRGNPIAVPTQARPWNPPFQTGPGMDAGTYRRDNGTITSTGVECIASNLCRVYTSTSPIGVIKAGDPVTISGATVNTALNGTWSVGVVDSAKVWLTIPGVSTITYNESTLQITMANDFPAGCGIDCVTTYGYKDMLDSFSNMSNWVFTANIEPRKIAWPYQFPDWNTNWLPAVWPGDSYPFANYTSSPPYTQYLAMLSGLTPGSISSYQANNWTFASGGSGTESILSLTKSYVGNDNQPLNAFSQYEDNTSISDSSRYPSQWNVYRSSVFQASAIQTWTLQVEYQMLGLYGQMQNIRYGTPTATGCNPPWGIPGGAIFGSGPHVEKMYNNTVGDGNISTHESLSNAWYVATPAINSQACYGSPQNQIDASYLEAFLDLVGRRRANGYANFMDSILSMQAGRNNATYDFYPGLARDGTDWGGLLRRNLFSTTKASTYWGFAALDYKTLMDETLTMTVAAINGQDASHWRTSIDNIASFGFSSTDCSFATTTAQAAYLVYLPGGTVNPCNFAASNLTYWTLFGLNSANITTVKNWAATLWPSHNFQLDIDAATEGDTGDYGTGNLVATGSHVITFSTKCPTVTHGLLIAGGGSHSEIPSITNNSCTPGSTGTITVLTTIAHPSGWKATGGCSTASLFPNSDIDFTSAWFRCKNMW